MGFLWNKQEDGRGCSGILQIGGYQIYTEVGTPVIITERCELDKLRDENRMNTCRDSLGLCSQCHMNQIKTMISTENAQIEKLKFLV